MKIALNLKPEELYLRRSLWTYQFDVVTVNDEAITLVGRRLPKRVRGRSGGVGRPLSERAQKLVDLLPGFSSVLPWETAANGARKARQDGLYRMVNRIAESTGKRYSWRPTFAGLEVTRLPDVLAVKGPETV